MLSFLKYNLIKRIKLRYFREPIRVRKLTFPRVWWAHKEAHKFQHAYLIYHVGPTSEFKLCFTFDNLLMYDSLKSTATKYMVLPTNIWNYSVLLTDSDHWLTVAKLTGDENYFYMDLHIHAEDTPQY